MNKINTIRVMMIALCIAFPDFANSQEMESAPSPSGSSVQPKTELADKIEYYDDGKVLACSKITSEGNVVSKSTYYHDGKIRKIERYDRDGDRIEESNYDENGKLDDNIDGWAAKKWVYEDGNLRSESTYGEDGHLTEQKIFNNQGDLVDRKYTGDVDIDPNEEFNRGSVVRYETEEFYDRYGNDPGMVRTDADDFDEMYYY